MEKVVHHSAESVAYRMENLKNTPDQMIRDELQSYLAEYRFQLPRYSYNLVYFDNHLRDTYENEPMLDKTERTVAERQNQGKSTSRELAEHQGIQYLDTALQGATLGDQIIWASPPGSKIEGYGNYGFIFSGVIDDISDNRKHLTMTAFRIEETSVDAYSQIINTILGQKFHFNTAEEFLAKPFVFRDFQNDIELAIREKIAPKKIDNQDFKLAMGVLEPLIRQFISEAKTGSSKQRLRKLFYTIEHLAIKLNKSTNFAELYSLSDSLRQNLEGIIQQHGMFKQPIVGGSCGSSGEDENIETLLNRNIMNRLTGYVLSKILGEDTDEHGSLTFTCGECGGKHTRPPHVILTICPATNKEMKKC